MTRWMVGNREPHRGAGYRTARQPKGRPHAYHDNPTTPGTCVTCGRSDPTSRNRVHQVDPLPDVPEQAEYRRRAGER